MIDAEVVRPAGPDWCVSDDVLVPFACARCSGVYADSPAFIVVDDPIDGRLRYCSDECAVEAGWTDAAVLRWRAHLNGLGLSIVYRP